MKNRLGVNDFEQSGSYNFFSYIIKLDGKITNNGNFLSSAMPAILHEYFHYYIQFNSAFYLEGFIYNLEIIHQLVLMNKDDITIPVLSNIENIEQMPNRDTLLVLYFLYHERSWLERMGNVDSSFFSCKISDIKKFVFSLGFKIDLPDYNEQLVIPEVVLHDNRRFIFSEDSINEGMAALLDKSLIFKYTNDNQVYNNRYGFPYDILDYFIELTGFSLQDFLLIGDISMQHPSPGYYFLQLLNKFHVIKKGGGKLDYESFYRSELCSGKIKEYRDYFKIKLDNLSIYKETPMGWIINKYESSIRRLDAGIIPIYFRLFSEESVDVYDIFRGFEPPLFLDDDGMYHPLLTANNADENSKSEHLFSIWKDNMFYRGLYAYRQYLLYGGSPKKCPLFNECKYNINNDELILTCRENYNLIESKYKIGCDMTRAIQFFLLLRGFEPTEAG